MFISKDDAADKNAGVTKVVFPNRPLYCFQKVTKMHFQDGKSPFILLI